MPVLIFTFPLNAPQQRWKQLAVTSHKFKISSRPLFFKITSYNIGTVMDAYASLWVFEKILGVWELFKFRIDLILLNKLYLITSWFCDLSDIFHEDHTFSGFNITKILFIYNSIFHSSVTSWMVKYIPVITKKKVLRVDLD